MSLSHLAFGMLHIMGVIISTIFFYIFSEWGMSKDIALPWLGLWLLG